MQELLAAGHSVFGVFSGQQTPEDGTAAGEKDQPDFVFYSMESGPFDVDGMQAFREAMVAASEERPPHPFIVRIPPVKDGAEQARANVSTLLDAGVDGVVFPHVLSSNDATVAVEAMGTNVWPVREDGDHWHILIVEDHEGIANVREIVSTAGASVVFPGPGDLRRAYDGDMEAVESAIQAVLSACKEFDVLCGITAGLDDIATRIEQGFRVFIISDNDNEREAILAGKAASGR